MVDNTQDELLNSLKTISISDLSSSFKDYDPEPINISSFNGLTSSDISSMSMTTIPTLTTAQLSAIGAVGSPSYTISNGTTTSLNWQSPNAIWTSNGTSGAVGATIGAPNSKVGQLSLKGDDADIDINGKSLKTWMEKVEERLNILTPNLELEQDWDDLRRLGERYRKLEKRCKEKAEAWNKLKSMPPPKVD